MPRFNFDLAGPRPVTDRQGMIFQDCYIAGRFAAKLAAELSIVRPDLREKASVVMTDEGRNAITYCVAIGTPQTTPLRASRDPDSTNIERDDANITAKSSLTEMV